MSLTRLKVPEKVNWLTPLYFVGQTPDKHAHWVCRCICGALTEKLTTTLVRGTAKSCGCKKYAAVAAGLSKALKKHGQSGYSETAEYRTWKAIHNRCYNPNSPKYPDYGARGIKVCQRWHSFESFFEDMGKRPADKTSIDRLDVNKDYELGNCEWSDSKQQARHRTDNVLIEYDGRTQCLSDWAKEVGIGRKVIKRRLDAGWPVERALTEGLSPDRVLAWETRRKKAA